LVFKSDEPDELRAENYYEAEYFSGGSTRYDERFEHRVNKAMRQLMAAQEFGELSRVVDVGCSLGYALEAARRLGLEPFGVDLSEHAVQHCRDLNFPAETGSMERLPLEDESVDLILLKHVLEHTPKPKDALVEVRRALRVGGLVLIAVPNLHYFKGRFPKLRHRYYDPNHAGREHFVYYSKRALKRLLEHCGFELCTSSKAVFRKRSAQVSGVDAIRETGRYLGLALWQAVATVTSTRRELFVIARRR